MFGENAALSEQQTHFLIECWGKKNKNVLAANCRVTPPEPLHLIDDHLESQTLQKETTSLSIVLCSCCIFWDERSCFIAKCIFTTSLYLACWITSAAVGFFSAFYELALSKTSQLCCLVLQTQTVAGKVIEQQVEMLNWGGELGVGGLKDPFFTWGSFSIVCQQRPAPATHCTIQRQSHSTWLTRYHLTVRCFKQCKGDLFIFY